MSQLPQVHQEFVSLLGGLLRQHDGLPRGQPTNYMPGTPEKLAVIIQRKKDRQSLWHPMDAGEELWIEERARMGVRTPDNGADMTSNEIVFEDHR